MLFRFILVLLVLIGAMVYAVWHLWTLFPFSPVVKGIVIGLYVAGILLTFVVFYMRGKGLPIPVARVAYIVSTTALFSFLYVFLYFIVIDLLRFCRLLPDAMWNGSWIGVAVFCAVLLAIGIGGWIRFHHPKRVELTLQSTTEQLARYPELKGKKIFMATDIHLGYIIRRRQLAEWVDLINREQPDLVLIAGDLVDGSIEPVEAENMAEEFARLQAPVYACLGNHEFYCGLDDARHFYDEANIRLLIDSVAVEQGVRIVGRDDATNRRRKPLSDFVYPDKSMFTIVLDHQPWDLDSPVKIGADMVLYGHNHNGQLWPGNLVVKAMYELGYGMKKKEGTTFYTSSGLGLWGARFRVGTQSEYIVATIQ